MSRPALALRATRVADFKDATQAALIVFGAYLAAAEAAFLVGTLSDKIFAPFWPPNIVLFCALLIVPRERAWLMIAAAFPAHVIAEVKIGMDAIPLVIAFVTNVAVSLAVAEVVRGLRFPWLRTAKGTVAYIVLIAVLCPAVIALGGAFVPITSGGALEQLPAFWLQWAASNTLGFLTLGPIALLFATEGIRALWPAGRSNQLELVGLLLLLGVVARMALPASVTDLINPYYLALLYAPVPFVVWCSVRFGVAGASASVLTVCLVFVEQELKSPRLFIGEMPEQNVFALQAVLFFLSIPVLLLGASSDEIRQLESSLDADEQRFALAARAANIGFWTHDKNTGALLLSDHGAHLFGRSGNGSQSIDALLKAVHPGDARAVDAVLRGHRPSVEFRVVSPQGADRWILARSDVEGRQSNAAVNGILVEITSRKAAETELDEQGRELAHLMRVSQLGVLSGGLAHELTQPLTAILANAQAARIMLASDPSNVALIDTVLNDIISEDQRAGEIIKRLRSLLRKQDTAFEEVDLGRICDSVLTLLRSEAIGRRMTIKFMAGLDVPRTLGDPIQLQQVVLNLVMNAIEAEERNTSSRRVVLLRSRRIGDSVEISVEDDGIGISPVHSARLFEPFFTTKERGLGLGLPICSAIVRKHGGTLAVENNAAGGATAYLRIPVHAESGEGCRIPGLRHE